MNKIYYLPIESYKERYTYQLTRWTINAFRKNNIKYVVINGDALENNDYINNSGPLDKLKRPYFSVTQISKLIKYLPEMTNKDCIYIDDMFTAGIETIPYILSGIPKNKRPKIVTRNYAQSVDIYDFTFKMRSWMRYYELMVDDFVDVIFCANEIHKELMIVGGYKSKIISCNLPFDSSDVRKLANIRNIRKTDRVVFSSRFDIEKNPSFYLDLANFYHKHYSKNVEFAILSGKKIFSGTDIKAVNRAKKQKNIKIYSNLFKKEYYDLLKNSKVQFNCALQDFVSFTMLEASALSIPSLVPNFRAFPESMSYNSKFLYTQYNLKECAEKLHYLLNNTINETEILKQSRLADKSFDIMINEIRKLCE